MSDPNSVGRVLASMAVAVICGGSSCHKWGDPQVTPNPGECLVLSNTETHGAADCSEQDEPGEPNGTLFTAVQLAPAACGGVKILGTLASADDVDFFQLPSCALPFLSINPLDRSTKEPTLTVKADEGTEVCLFASCSYGPTSLQGCSGSVDQSSADGGAPEPAHLQEGMLGCCRRSSGTLGASISCDSLSPSINGYIMVESVERICHVPYEVTFSINSL